MAFPQSGLIKIFPSTVSIVSGEWALNSDASPQPNRPVADLQAYFNARITNLAVAPNLRKATEYPAASGVYVPAISPYELQFVPSTIGFEFYNGAYPSPIVATLDFLDANFPMGMRLTQPQVYFTGQTLFGPNRDRTLDSLIFKYTQTTIRTYTPAAGLETGTQTSGTTSIIPSISISWSIIKLLNTFGMSIPVTSIVSALGGIPRSVISECFILAAYNTQTFAITTTTPNALPGNIAELNSSSDAFENFDQDQFRIYWDTLEDEEDVNPTFPGWTGGILIPRNLILTFTNSQFRFIIPNDQGIPYGGRRLMLTGTGNSAFFVGEFPLQNFNVELVDPSGLYTLVDNKTNDTYYDRSVSPVVTTKLKIPDPFVKTGFFNG